MRQYASQTEKVARKSEVTRKSREQSTLEMESPIKEARAASKWGSANGLHVFVKELFDTYCSCLQRSRSQIEIYVAILPNCGRAFL